MKSFLKTGLALGLAAVTCNAFAGTATDNLTVNATVIPNCLVDASSALAFGNYDPISANQSGVPLDKTTDVTVTCTNGIVGAVLAAGNGANFGATRNLAKGADLLPYAIFSDAGYSAAFANEAVTADGTPQPISLYGRIDGGVNVPIGAYSDTVVMTVNF